MKITDLNDMDQVGELQIFKVIFHRKEFVYQISEETPSMILVCTPLNLFENKDHVIENTWPLKCRSFLFKTRSCFDSWPDI